MRLPRVREVAGGDGPASARGLTTLVVAVGVLAGACTSAVTGPTPPNETIPPPEAIRVAGALAQFDACETFLDYVISHGVDLVGPYGLGFPDIFGRLAGDFGGAETDAAGEGTGSGGPSHSTTNVQVEGVDEPDIVKTDGERIVLISEGDLVVVDITGDRPVETGRLAISDMSVGSLFVSGDKALLFGSVWSPGPVPLGAVADIAPFPGSATLTILEVDISSEPEVVRTMEVDGSLVSARMIGDSVRLVVGSGPVGFEWSYPTGDGLRAERRAIEENREILRDSTEENWIPYYVVTGAGGAVESEGTLFDCDRAAHPVEFSGLDMLSIVTVDLSRGLEIVDATGLLATGDNVYASEDNLYVATQDWQTWTWIETREPDERPDGPVTEIHKFDISDPAATEYMATGAVNGFLLNQFAMDEHEGMLRVASTTTPNWWGSGPDSESMVTVLRQVGEVLVRVGSVDGLGVSEQIYAVRFMGDVGYVVTFRQTDPLYTLDLSDPRAPRVAGELKIPGYSAYLHPVGESLVLGVGQDATEEGMVQGTQVSVFDVGDLASPQRLDTFTLSEGTSSQAEYDHHAFLHWDGLVIVPVQKWAWDENRGDSVFMGAVGLRIDGDGGLAEVATVVHPGGDGKDWDGRSQILRTVVVGDSVYTISAKGIMESALGDLSEISWLDL